jgi:hypothetical protein
MTMERIVAAAMLVDGRVFCGPGHIEAFDAAVEEMGLDWRTALERFTFSPGFITCSGRFVDRNEALTIAQRFGQLNGLPMTGNEGLPTECVTFDDAR